MAAKRTRKIATRASAHVLKVRAELSAALLRASSVHGLSQEGAARDIGVDARTIRRWVHREVSMDVELVAAAPIVGKTFRRMWCSEAHESSPYVARKRRSSR